MNAFNKRFFVCISLIFLGFTAISFNFKNLIFFPIFLLLVAMFYLILSKKRIKDKNLRLLSCLLIVAAFLGVLSSRLTVIKNDSVLEKYSGEHYISGYVAEVSASYGFMSEYVVHVEGVDDKQASFNLVLVTEYQGELSRGDFFEISGNLLPLEYYEGLKYIKNNNAYDYPLICSIDDKVEVKYLEREFRIPLMLSDLNSKLSSNFKAILGKDSGSLASALLLGNRELLSDNTLRDFKRAGVYHMLALSGLHVAILVGVFDWLLRKFFMPRGARICILTGFSLFYVALTGFALSACRSMLMLWVMYLALIVGKKRDAMTSLFIAVSVIVLISPAAILDIGLQLSFLSTFGVICASIIGDKIRWLKEGKNESGIKAAAIGIIRKLALISIASLCVFIMTLPLIMTYFGEVSLATFISNVFMGVVCEIFMIFALLTIILSWSPYLRIPFAEISVRVGESMSALISAISDIDGVMLSLKYPRIEFLVWGLFFGFLVLLAIQMKRKWLIFIPSIAFAILLCINIAFYQGERSSFTRVEYLGGDKLVLSSADEVYICDSSDGLYGNLYESVEIAKENCFTEIDGIILTHYHSKHIASLERLIKNHKIHSVLLPMPQNSEEDLIMRSIVRVLDDGGVPAYVYDNECELDILGGKLSISPRAYSSDYAHPSVGMSFAYGQKRITILGSPYFGSYLESSGIFKRYIEESDYLIFGADGHAVTENFNIFDSLKPGCEVTFSGFEAMNKSDFEMYLHQYKIYFDAEYKKYDFK